MLCCSAACVYDLQFLSFSGECCLRTSLWDHGGNPQTLPDHMAESQYYLLYEHKHTHLYDNLLCAVERYGCRRSDF